MFGPPACTRLLFRGRAGDCLQMSLYRANPSAAKVQHARLLNGFRDDNAVLLVAVVATDPTPPAGDEHEPMGTVLAEELLRASGKIVLVDGHELVDTEVETTPVRGDDGDRVAELRLPQ